MSGHARRRPASFIAVGLAAWLVAGFWLQPIVFVFRGGAAEQLAAILTTLGAWACAVPSVSFAAYRRGRVQPPFCYGLRPRLSQRQSSS
jgi:hypothetical protein